MLEMTTVFVVMTESQDGAELCGIFRNRHLAEKYVAIASEQRFQFGTFKIYEEPVLQNHTGKYLPENPVQQYVVEIDHDGTITRVGEFFDDIIGENPTYNPTWIEYISSISYEDAEEKAKEYLNDFKNRQATV